MSERVVNGKVQRRKVRPANIALYDQDHEAIEQIRRARQVDSNSAAVRWALRYVASMLRKQDGIAA